MKERAVCVCFDGDRVLVIRRWRNGRAYCVLPGGGIELGETPEQAAIRELREETGLEGQVLFALATILHEDRVAHYFRVHAPAGELALGEPELQDQTAENIHAPTWISADTIDVENLLPNDLRPLVASWKTQASGSLT